MKYENRIRDIQTELKTTKILLESEQEKTSILKDNQQLLKNQVAFVEAILQNPLQTISVPQLASPQKQLCDELKLELGKKPEKVIKQLESLKLTGDLLDSLIHAISQFKRHKKSKTKKNYHTDTLDQQYSQCIDSFLYLLDQLKEDGILD